MGNIEQYDIRIVAHRDFECLAEKWQALEAHSNATFFLSWSWVSTWLASYSPNTDVFCVYHKGELVGLSLLCRSTFSSWKRFSSHRLHVNQTGDPALDQIWTEYNGLLCSLEHEEQILGLFLPYLVKYYTGWDELQLGAITKRLANTLHESSNLMRLDLWQSPSYGVDLEQLHAEENSFLGSLSRNTRYQIRRSLKLYDSEGGVRLQFADSKAEAQRFFEEIAPLHLAKWGSKPGESGFSNPAFVKFHQHLIDIGFPLKQVDVIKIFCGERVLGYLYNFLYKGRVYFYLSGLVSEQDAKLKPGLCSHAIAIQHYMDKGFIFYDFMGGQDRYKSSLGKAHEELYHISLQKPCLKFKMESFLREVKQHFSS